MSSKAFRVGGNGNKKEWNEDKAKGRGNHEPREGPRTTKGEMHALIPK
jgi:hypothetical protein